MEELVRQPGNKDLPVLPENLTKEVSGFKGSVYYLP